MQIDWVLTFGFGLISSCRLFNLLLVSSLLLLSVSLGLSLSSWLLCFLTCWLLFLFANHFVASVSVTCGECILFGEH